MHSGLEWVKMIPFKVLLCFIVILCAATAYLVFQTEQKTILEKISVLHFPDFRVDTHSNG